MEKIFRDHSHVSLTLLKENIDLQAFSNGDFDSAKTDFDSTVENIHFERFKTYDGCCPLLEDSICVSFHALFITNVVMT